MTSKSIAACAVLMPVLGLLFSNDQLLRQNWDRDLEMGVHAVDTELRDPDVSTKMEDPIMRRSLFSFGVLLPSLALFSGPAPDSRPDHGTATPMTLTWDVEEDASADAMDCQFAIRASNNMSFDVWVDLYDSRLDNGGFGVFGGFKPLKIQNHRISPGKTMDRRYTASGNCTKERRWEFWVRIGRADGKKIYKYVYRTTKGDSSSSRTVDLGKSSTWGL